MTMRGDSAEIYRSVHPYKQPPDDFDPLQATDRQLAEYGLPERWYAHTEPRYLEFWREMVGPAPAGVARKFVGYPDPRAGESPDVWQMPTPRARFDHRETSQNWSGAYITPIPRPNRFMLVAGSWTVPAAEPPDIVPSGVNPTAAEYRSSTWIGIGGHRSYNTMPQIGTSQFVTVNGATATTNFGAWWQWWVDGSKPHHIPNPIPNFEVHAYDEILAMIIIEAPSPGEAHFILTNQRTGAIVAFKVGAPANIEPLGSTAEWVHERPSEPATRHRYPLPKSSDVVFRNCFALNAPGFGTPMTFQDLHQNARLIRMAEHFPNPHRSALVSIPERLSSTSLRISYREAGGS
jgi:Peptidase A4 family